MIDVLVLVTIVTTLAMLAAFRMCRNARKEATVWRHAYFAAIDVIERLAYDKATAEGKLAIMTTQATDQRTA